MPNPNPIPTTTATTAPVTTPAVEPVEPTTVVKAEEAKRINAPMLWYALSTYAYKLAYLQTVKDIQTSPDGNGIFQMSNIELRGIDNNEEIIKAKAILDGNKINVAAAIAVASDPEELASGVTKEEAMEVLGVEPPEEKP